MKIGEGGVIGQLPPATREYDNAQKKPQPTNKEAVLNNDAPEDARILFRTLAHKDTEWHVLSCNLSTSKLGSLRLRNAKFIVKDYKGNKYVAMADKLLLRKEEVDVCKEVVL